MFKTFPLIFKIIPFKFTTRLGVATRLKAVAISAQVVLVSKVKGAVSVVVADNLYSLLSVLFPPAL
jgi:hypothetical protein